MDDVAAVASPALGDQTSQSNQVALAPCTAAGHQATVEFRDHSGSDESAHGKGQQGVRFPDSQCQEDNSHDESKDGLISEAAQESIGRASPPG